MRVRRGQENIPPLRASVDLPAETGKLRDEHWTKGKSEKAAAGRSTNTMIPYPREPSSTLV